MNREVSRTMRAGLRSVIRHPDIRVHQPELYRSDRVHLSDVGIGLFLKDLQGGLRAEIFGCHGRLGAYK